VILPHSSDRDIGTGDSNSLHEGMKVWEPLVVMMEVLHNGGGRSTSQQTGDSDNTLKLK